MKSYKSLVCQKMQVFFGGCTGLLVSAPVNVLDRGPWWSCEDSARAIVRVTALVRVVAMFLAVIVASDVSTVDECLKLKRGFRVQMKYCSKGYICEFVWQCCLSFTCVINRAWSRPISPNVTHESTDNSQFPRRVEIGRRLSETTKHKQTCHICTKKPRQHWRRHSSILIVPTVCSVPLHDPCWSCTPAHIRDLAKNGSLLEMQQGQTC